MLLLPYKVERKQEHVERESSGLPIVTILVMLLCIITFFIQQYSWHLYEKDMHNFCRYELQGVLNKTLNKKECLELFVRLDLAKNREEVLNTFIRHHALENLDPQAVNSQLKRMQSIVPNPAIMDWRYQPEHFRLATIFTSKITHLNWQHLLFNMVFFLAFAVAAEHLLGHGLFSVFLITSAATTTLVYNLPAINTLNGEPAIGLSSIITSTMILTSAVYPHKFLRFFFWLIFVSGTFRLPLLLISISYIGSDIYSISIEKTNNHLNYLSHIAGATTGLLAAASIYAYKFFRKRGKFL